MQRVYFVFSDLLQVGGSLAPCWPEGQIYENFEAAAHLPNKQFAGIVCVADREKCSRLCS